MSSLTRLNRGSLDKVNETLLPIDKTNLIRYYAYWENAGTTLYDESKGGNAGTIDGPVWAWTGLSKPGLDFDGTDDYVNIPTFSDFNNYGAFTMVALSYRRGVNDGTKSPICVANTNNGILLRGQGAGSMRVTTNATGWANIIVADANNVWNMWTVRWDGSTIELIKNDFAATDSMAQSNTTAANDVTQIGGRSSKGNYLDGILALFLVYKTAKSDTFITNMAEKLGVV